jgi:hypothetical protein
LVFGYPGFNYKYSGDSKNGLQIPEIFDYQTKDILVSKWLSDSKTGPIGPFQLEIQTVSFIY